MLWIVLAIAGVVRIKLRLFDIAAALLIQVIILVKGLCVVLVLVIHVQTGCILLRGLLHLVTLLVFALVWTSLEPRGGVLTEVVGRAVAAAVVVIIREIVLVVRVVQYPLKQFLDSQLDGR